MQEIVTYKAGSFIYVEGDEDINCIYIIKTGKVEQQSSIKEMKGVNQVSGPGDTLGFVSTLSNRPRMVSAKAIEDSTLVKLSRDNFLSLLHKQPDIALKIINFYAGQLRHFNSMVISNDVLVEEFADIKLFELGTHFYKTGVLQYAQYALSKYLDHYPQGTFAIKARHLTEKINKPKKRAPFEPIVDGINKTYRDKQIIFCEHEPGDELYIIKEGKVKIVKHTKNNEVILSLLKEGDIFGELAIISEKPRNATAISFGASTIMGVNRSSLKALLEKSPEMLKKIVLSVSQRVWFTIIRLEAKLYRKPITRIYTFLENKLLEENISLKSTSPVTLNFGIDELLKMTDISQEKIGDDINEILQDQCISFNFGMITIESPRDLSSRAKALKAKDSHVTASEKKKDIESVAAADNNEISQVRELPETDSLSVQSPNNTQPKQSIPAQQQHDASAPVKSKEQVLSEKFSTSIPAKPVNQAPNQEKQQKEQIDIEMLIGKLNSGNKRYIISAADRLEKYGESAKNAVPALQRFFAEDNKNIRRAVVKAVSSILPDDEATEFFSQLLTDTSPNVRCSATRGLGEIQPANQKHITNVLLNIINDPEAEVRANVVRSLGLVGTEAIRAISRVMKRMSDPDESVRAFAVQAVANIGYKSREKSLLKKSIEEIRKHDKSKHVRAEAKEALKTLKKK